MCNKNYFKCTKYINCYMSNVVNHYSLFISIFFNVLLCIVLQDKRCIQNQLFNCILNSSLPSKWQELSKHCMLRLGFHLIFFFAVPFSLSLVHHCFFFYFIQGFFNPFYGFFLCTHLFFSLYSSLLLSWMALV